MKKIVQSIVLLSILFQPLFMQAKCNCGKPHLPSTTQHNSIPHPVNPPAIPQQPMPPDIILPTETIPVYGEEQVLGEDYTDQNSQVEAPSETLSKEEVRKMALIFGGIVATISVLGGSLLARFNRQASVQGISSFDSLNERLNEIEKALKGCLEQLAQNGKAIEGLEQRYGVK